jgi:hypothetical protein
MCIRNCPNLIFKYFPGNDKLKKVKTVLIYA